MVGVCNEGLALLLISASLHTVGALERVLTERTKDVLRRQTREVVGRASSMRPLSRDAEVGGQKESEVRTQSYEVRVFLSGVEGMEA